MKCPKCDSLQDKVMDSRLRFKDTVVRRRRKCLDCKFEWITVEISEKIFDGLKKGLKKLKSLSIVINDLQNINM